MFYFFFINDRENEKYEREILIVKYKIKIIDLLIEIMEDNV